MILICLISIGHRSNVSGNNINFIITSINSIGNEFTAGYLKNNFGSCAHGKQGPDSDLDLLIVQQTDLPKHKRTISIRRLFKPQPCTMDILVYTPEEIEYWNGTVNHIITDAFETGKIFYEQKTSLSRFILSKLLKNH